MTRPRQHIDERRVAVERAALDRYCPVHRAEPGHLCVLLDGDGATITTGICSTRMSGRL